MFCPHCGTENIDGSKICYNCRQSLLEPPISSAQAASETHGDRDISTEYLHDNSTDTSRIEKKGPNSAKVTAGLRVWHRQGEKISAVQETVPEKRSLVRRPLFIVLLGVFMVILVVHFNKRSDNHFSNVPDTEPELIAGNGLDDHISAMPDGSPGLSPSPSPSPSQSPSQSPSPTPKTMPNVPEVITIIDGIQAPVQDFIFSYSSQRRLTEEELESMVSGDLDEMHSKSQMAINEMFARYGYTFGTGTKTSREAKAYFESKGWYESAKRFCPSTSWSELQSEYMNDIERENIKIINEWQKEYGIYY